MASLNTVLHSVCVGDGGLECEAIKRLTATLKYYAQIQADPNQKALFLDFLSTQYPHHLDDISILCITTMIWRS